MRRTVSRMGEQGALVGAAVGLVLGVIYAIGGFFVDLFTTGLNMGTALAMMALPLMPVMVAVAGFVAGALVGIVWWLAVARRRQG